MAASTDQQSSPSTLTKSRVEAFSDGVIAVVATLLVLEIKEPEVGADIWAHLRHEAPSLLAYVVSFLTILIFWVNHHALFQALERVSRAMLFGNGLLLLTISFIPYLTAVLGRALVSGAYAKSAAVLYALSLGLAALCFTGLWVCTARRPGLVAPTTRSGLRRAILRSLTGPSLYAGASVIALLNAPASLVIDAGAALFFSVRPRGRRLGQRLENENDND